MLQDRYGNGLSTSSVAARDAYVLGMDRFLAADAGVDEAFGMAVAEDPGFSAAYLALARNRQIRGRGKEARALLAQAREVARDLTEYESGHLGTLGLLIEGKSGEGYTAARAQLADHPRDAVVAGACLGVFGLIGFSGQAGRESENLALAEILAPAYGDDWWFLCNLAFAQMEAGQVGPASGTIERSMALNPRNANMAHYRSHLFYENGEAEAGLAYLDAWRAEYDRDGLLHCHVSWHVALWSLAMGDEARMWQVIDSDIAPGASPSPPLSVLTDMAAILYRAELAGVTVSQSRWAQVSDYATEHFAKPGLAFADVHAAIAHAMAGNADALSQIIDGAKGPAGDMVQVLAQAFRAIAAADWATACTHLTAVMSAHQRIGGSRAQRDLIEYALAGVLLRMGRGEEARRILMMHRPLTSTAGVIQGL